MIMKSGAPMASAVKGPCASAYSDFIQLLNSCEAIGDMLHPLHPYRHPTRVWSRVWEATKCAEGNHSAGGSLCLVEDHHACITCRHGNSIAVWNQPPQNGKAA